MAKKQKKLDDISKKFGDEREKALNDALKLIEKDFGKGSIMRLGERAEQKVQVMSSGSLALDIALGAGGYPKGRIIEIYGPESSGKTTVALHAVAQAQKEGGIAAAVPQQSHNSDRTGKPYVQRTGGRRCDGSPAGAGSQGRAAVRANRPDRHSTSGGDRFSHDPGRTLRQNRQRNRRMKTHIANIITGIRILGSILLAFVPVFSAVFYTVYLTCGLSDMADGMIARKTNNVSSFGARFDTAADFLFAAVSLVKLLPYIPVPRWLWKCVPLEIFCDLGIIKIGTLIKERHEMPEICRFYGIVIKMFFKPKEHEPSHLHALYGEHIGIFDLKTMKMTEGDLPTRAQQLVQEWMSAHQDRLLEMWDTQKLEKLPPL